MGNQLICDVKSNSLPQSLLPSLLHGSRMVKMYPLSFEPLLTFASFRLKQGRFCRTLVVEDQLKSDECTLHLEVVKIFSVPPNLKLLQLHVDSLMEVYERLFSSLTESRESIRSPTTLATIGDYFVATTVEWLADDGRVVLRRPFGDISLEQLLPIGHQPQGKPFVLIVEGRNLEDFEVRWIALQLYSAIKQFHDLDYYHGSLSPSNVIIDPATLDVKLVDIAPYKPFYLGHDDPGIALFFFDPENKYLAPERFHKDETLGKDSVTSLQKSADLYALGMILGDLLGEDCGISRHLIENRSFVDAPDIVRDSSTVNFLMPYIKGSLNSRKSSLEKLQRIAADKDDLLVLFSSNQEASLLIVRQLLSIIDDVYLFDEDESISLCLKLLNEFGMSNNHPAKSRILMPSLSSLMIDSHFDTSTKLQVLDVISSCIDDVSVIKAYFGTMMSWLDLLHEPVLRARILECLCTMAKYLDEIPVSLERHLELAIQEPSLDYLSTFLNFGEKEQIELLLEKLEGSNTAQMLKGLRTVEAKINSEEIAFKVMFSIFPGLFIYPDDKVRDLSFDILGKICSFLAECDQVVNVCPLLKRVMKADVNVDYFLPDFLISKVERNAFYTLLADPIDSELFKLISRNQDQLPRFLKELEEEDSAKLGMLKKFLPRTENSCLKILERNSLNIKLSYDLTETSDSFSPITNSVTSLQKSDYEPSSVWPIGYSSAMFDRGLSLKFGKLSKANVSPDAKCIAFYDGHINAVTVWRSADFVAQALSDPFLEIAVQVDEFEQIHFTLSNTDLIIILDGKISIYSLKLSALVKENEFIMDGEILEIKLISSSHLLLVYAEMIRLWSIDENNEVWCTKRHPAYHGKITSVCYFPEQNHLFLITGSSEGYLSLWDLRYGLRVRSWRLPLHWSFIIAISSYSPLTEDEFSSLMYPPCLWISAKANIDEDDCPLKDLLLVDLGKAQVELKFAPSLPSDLLLLEDQPYTDVVFELKAPSILAIASIVGTEWLVLSDSDGKVWYYSTNATQKKPKLLLTRSIINFPIDRLYLIPFSSRSMLLLLGSEEASIYSLIEFQR